MKTVKTYQIENDKKKKVSFGISKMEDVFSKRNGKTDEPHRHNYFTILIIHKAKGFHKIDFNKYRLDKNQIYFIAPGQVHQVIEKEKPKGFSLIFSNEFLLQNAIPITFIDSLNLFQNYGQTPPLLANKEEFKNLETFCEKIIQLYRSDSSMKNLSIGAYLKLLLIECNQICTSTPIPIEKSTSNINLLRKFKTAVNNHYKTEHFTTFYANQLAISPDHLNRIIKSKIGKTAKEYIQSRILTEAKRLLYFSDLSNKEIAYSLGFKEPANFSAFFKKNANISPTDFKKTES